MLNVNNLELSQEIFVNFKPFQHLFFFILLYSFANSIANYHMNRIFIYILISIAMLSCSSKKSSHFQSVMSNADMLMDECQDSALVSLSLLDEISADISSMSKSDRMQYYLLVAKAMNKGYIDFTSDSTMLIVADYYMNHGNDKEKLMSNYLLGCVYRDLRDSPKALPYLYKATEYANDDMESYMMLMRIHNQIAELYMNQALVTQAVKEYDIVYNYSMLAADTIDAILSINRKASAYSLINQVDSAVILKDKAISMFNAIGLKKYAAQISGSCIGLLLNAGMYENAKKNSSFYETHSGYYKNGEVSKGHETYYYGKGRLYLHSNQLDSAKILFEKCGDYIDDPKMKVMTYRGLSLLYDKMHIPDSTAKYAMLAYEANDSAYQIIAAQTMLNLESVYNYGRYQETAKSQSEKLVVFQRWLLGSVLFSILAVLSSLFVSKSIKKRNEKKVSVIRERYETEKKLLQNEMEELNALLEEKAYLLDNKESIFLQKHNEMNLEIEKKEQSIIELLERVKEYERNLKIKDSAKVEEEIQSSQIKKVFVYFANHVTAHPSDTHWNQLTNFVKENLPQLYMVLHNNNVSQKELRMCILIRLKFKPGEIATIMDCRFPEVSLTRSRLLRKIYGIENGKASDFDRRLMLLY